MFKNRINAVRVLLASGALALGSAAHAALPADTGTAITSYKEDALSAIGLVMAAGVAIWGLKRLARQLGWF